MLIEWLNLKGWQYQVLDWIWISWIPYTLLLGYNIVQPFGKPVWQILIKPNISLSYIYMIPSYSTPKYLFKRNENI